MERKNKKTKNQIIVVHGGDSFNKYEEYINSLKEMEIDIGRFKAKKWKSSLEKDLGNKFEVILPSFPNSSNAKYLEWRIYFEKLLPLLNKEIILLGHSLGAIFLIKYLSENKIKNNILGLFLISAPYPSMETKEFLFKVNGKNIESQCKNIFMYHSKDDKVVDFKDFEKYKKEFNNVKFKVFKNRGHFNQSKFPEIIRDIKSIKK